MPTSIPNNSKSPKKMTNKTTDKKKPSKEEQKNKKLSTALRQNLLRRKAGTKKASWLINLNQIIITNPIGMRTFGVATIYI